jgi:hypothetical protein
MIEQTIKINYLLDFYKELLTEKQKFALEMYYQEDLSIVEIAENLEVSRQAIHDLLKRGEHLLEDYEEKLKLYEKYLTRKNKADKLIDFVQEATDFNKIKESIIKQVNEITE